ncbi:amino acid ABC transporter substrate-binding protein [Siminovitchia acidinfaciens]|uniref:Amino acid ABC transporter substrate-binding protein n=1 Tax=Siminovitchia acidinfaciens TaxID=2321395 RepID=A0A429Y714_9BACI|nr:transporter substrate-binding domain-containing protein [Siminovitchia acidinfaciens]RST77173.1 amino acid ABC transporter substrate-binding protein [Siminovitchia acidinfaciens]
MKKIKLFFLLSLAVFFMVLSACSSKDQSDKTLNDSAAADEFYNHLQDKGTIEVGSTPSGPPFTFLNTETNEIDGLMVDISKSIGEKLDLDVNINSVNWVSLMPSLNGEKIDMIAAGMGITEKRKEEIDFSQPVYSYGEALVVLNGNDSIQSIDDLQGKKIGVQEATLYYDELIKESGINVQPYKTIQDMTKELINGRIDAYVADYPVYQMMLKELPDAKDKISAVPDYEPRYIVDLGLGIPKNTPEFQKALNGAIDEMKQSGELDKLIKKWELK